jgi:hypothetical protein
VQELTATLSNANGSSPNTSSMVDRVIDHERHDSGMLADAIDSRDKLKDYAQNARKQQARQSTKIKVKTLPAWR